MKKYSLLISIGLTGGVLFLSAGCGGSTGGTPSGGKTGEVQVTSRAMSLDPQGAVLNSPVTVAMPYTQDDLDELGIADPALLVVYQYDHAGGAWEKVDGSTVDQAQSVVRFSTTTMTMYRLAAETD